MLSGCASNTDRPDRQVAIYTGIHRVTYAPVSHYSCQGGRVEVIAQATAAEGTAAESSSNSSVSLAGRRCYYADGYRRPSNATIAVEGGVGGLSTGVGASTSIGRGGINIGGRARLP